MGVFRETSLTGCQLTCLMSERKAASSRTTRLPYFNIDFRHLRGAKVALVWVRAPRSLLR